MATAVVTAWSHRLSSPMAVRHTPSHISRPEREAQPLRSLQHHEPPPSIALTARNHLLTKPLHLLMLCGSYLTIIQKTLDFLENCKKKNIPPSNANRRRRWRLPSVCVCCGGLPARVKVCAHACACFNVCPRKRPEQGGLCVRYAQIN